MNVDIQNIDHDEIKLISLFICAIGFEERSIYQLEINSKKDLVSTQTVLCFNFNDNKTEISHVNYQKVSGMGLDLVDIDKGDVKKLKEIIKTKIESLLDLDTCLEIHVDYSSMPRSWYSNIFVLLTKVLRPRDRFYFWYSHGDYSQDINHCSNAGADDFIIFSGKASIKPRNRTHILGLGYDTVKSDAIRTVVDPSTLVLCYTYPTSKKEILATIHKEHERILNAAALSVSLPIEDFGFIVKRIKELVLDLYDRGDVVLIPDGPKPLILACSIVPELIGKIGIVCFHVTGHSSNFVAENIKPTGFVSGFVVKILVDEKIESIS